MPIFYENSYSLQIDGLVRKPRSFSYDELRALPQRPSGLDLPLRDRLDGQGRSLVGDPLQGSARPRRAASRPRRPLRFVSLEVPYTDSLTIDQARLHDVMVALDMDGQPLSRPHGSPARVVIPEMYGYKGVKWLTRIELVAHEPTGYWEGLGYDQNAWVGRSNGYG